MGQDGVRRGPNLNHIKESPATYDGKTARRARVRIGPFSGDVLAELGVLAQRFAAEMMCGTQASGSVLLTEVARALRESIAVRKAHMRLSRNLRRPEIEGMVQDSILRLAAPQVGRDAARR